WSVTILSRLFFVPAAPQAPHSHSQRNISPPARRRGTDGHARSSSFRQASLLLLVGESGKVSLNGACGSPAVIRPRLVSDDALCGAIKMGEFVIVDPLNARTVKPDGDSNQRLGTPTA